MAFKIVGTPSLGTAAAVARLNATLNAAKGGNSKPATAGLGSNGGAVKAAASVVSAAAPPIAVAAQQAILLLNWKGPSNKGATYVDKLVFTYECGFEVNVPKDISSDEVRALDLIGGQKKMRSVMVEIDDLARFSIRVDYSTLFENPSRGVQETFSYPIHVLKKPKYIEANETYVMEVSFSNNNPNTVGVSGRLVKMGAVAVDQKVAAKDVSSNKAPPAGSAAGAI